MFDTHIAEKLMSKCRFDVTPAAIAAAAVGFSMYELHEMDRQIEIMYLKFVIFVYIKLISMTSEQG